VVSEAIEQRAGEALGGEHAALPKLAKLENSRLSRAVGVFGRHRAH